MKNIGVLLMLLFIVSCSQEYPKIPLDKLDPVLKAQGDLIISDFVRLSSENKDFYKFLKEDYITPMVHRNLMPDGIYFYAPTFIAMELGEIKSYELYEVIDKDLVKMMRYRLKTELRSNEFTEIAIDVNQQYSLSKIYFFVQNNDQFSVDYERVNLFSEAIRSFKK